MNQPDTSQSDVVAQYGQIKSDYARIAPLAETAEAIKKTSDSLPRVQPQKLPIEEERKAIQQHVNQSFLLLQIVLGILLVCMLVYAILPIDYSQPIVFLLLCVGVAVGIFLTK